MYFFNYSFGTTFVLRIPRKKSISVLSEHGEPKNSKKQEVDPNNVRKYDVGKYDFIRF